jgi:hypothetical protein
MTLPPRFVVWEAEEFQTGVVQVCNTQYLLYNHDDVLRIYPEEEPQRIYNRIIRGRVNSEWHPRHEHTGRCRVQLSHHTIRPIYFIITDYLITPFNLHTGEQMDEQLPLVLIYGEYLYGTARPPNNYSFELMSDFMRVRYTIEDMYTHLLNTYNLPIHNRPPIWRQPAIWEEHRRRPLMRYPEIPEEFTQTILETSFHRRQSVTQHSSPVRPAERIALAIARDFQREGEVCPITQEPLKQGEISVTGCFCVFQGDALQRWATSHSTCPSCRKQLIYRTVTVGEAENIMIGN